MNPASLALLASTGSLDTLTLAFRESDPIGKTIVVILLVMSILAWSIMVSKWIELKTLRRFSRLFHDRYSRQNHPFELLISNRPLPPCPLAAIYRAAAREAAFLSLPGSDMASAPLDRLRLTSTQLDIIRRAVDRTASDQALAIESKMPLLAISVNAAPFLGLLGTVWGVLVAFTHMTTSTGGALLGAVAPGIAGALLTTVVGLLVALPSAIGYNLLVAEIKIMAVQMDNFADELMADLQSACTDRAL